MYFLLCFDVFLHHCCWNFPSNPSIHYHTHTECWGWTKSWENSANHSTTMQSVLFHNLIKNIYFITFLGHKNMVCHIFYSVFHHKLQCLTSTYKAVYFVGRTLEKQWKQHNTRSIVSGLISASLFFYHVTANWTSPSADVFRGEKWKEMERPPATLNFAALRRRAGSVKLDDGWIFSIFLFSIKTENNHLGKCLL